MGSTEILQWRGPKWAASLKHAPDYLMRLQSSSAVYQDSKLKCEVSIFLLLRLLYNAFLRIIDSENCCHAQVPLHTSLSQSRTAAESVNATVDHPLILSRQFMSLLRRNCGTVVSRRAEQLPLKTEL